jgi:hypothetical protein
MHTHFLKRLSVALFASLALTACDSSEADGTALVTAPSAFTGSGAFGEPAPFSGPALAASKVRLVRFPHARCPDASPYGTNLVLIVNQNGAPDAFLIQADFRFFDSTGLVSPAVFAQTDLSAMFGTTLVPAGTSRQFEFAPRFGCGLSFAPHSVSARFVTRDHLGARHERTLEARF